MISSQRFPRLRTEDDDFRVFLDYLSGIDSVDFLADVHNIPTASVEMILDVYLDEALDDSPEPRFNPAGRPPKFSDAQKDEIADKYLQDESYSVASLAQEYDSSPKLIRKILAEKSISMRKCGHVTPSSLPSNRGRKKKLTPEQELELIRRYQNEPDTTRDTLCSDFSISTLTLSNILKRHGIEFRGQNRKLTEDQEDELVRRYQNDLDTTRQALCSEFSISSQGLSNILKRRGLEASRPRHVPDNRKLTEDQEDELVRRYQNEPNTPRETLCSDFSIADSTLYSILERRGIELRGHDRKLTSDQEDELVRRYQNEPDTHIDTLSSEFSIASPTVFRVLKRRGIELRGQKRKLTSDLEDELVRRYQNEPDTMRDTLCSEFSISNATLSRILKRRGIERSRL